MLFIPDPPLTLLPGVVATPTGRSVFLVFEPALRLAQGTEDRDLDAIRESRQNSADAMAILDRYLGKTDYVAGSNFSICDIPVGVFTFRWINMDIEREEYPNLRRWYDQLGERPAYREHIMNPLT